MRLRGAWGNEAEDLARVHGKAFAGGWSAADIASLLDGPGGFALLIEDADVVGFVLCRTIAGEAEILTLAVDPQAQRKGLGRALVEGSTGAARMAGAQSMFLEVAEDNVPARALYRRCGFAEVGIRRGYYARGAAPAVDAVVMRLDLGPAA